MVVLDTDTLYWITIVGVELNRLLYKTSLVIVMESLPLPAQPPSELEYRKRPKSRFLSRISGTMIVKDKDFGLRRSGIHGPRIGEDRHGCQGGAALFFGGSEAKAMYGDRSLFCSK